MSKAARLKAIDAEIKRLEDEELREGDLAAKYRDENKIEFFDKRPFYPGPNPLQAELLEAWLDPNLKVFTYTGSNRLGKTTILVLLSFATIFGRFPWNDQKLHFRHTLPRRVRLVGQDWEKHIKAVLMPDMEKWWPKNRLVKKKKNNQGIDAVWTDVKTKGTIEIMSNGQESELHEGWSGDLVGYDEPPKRDIRVANARGLIDRNGRELFAMTLLKEAWVDREVIKATLEDGRPDPTVFNVSGDIWQNVGFGITEEGVEQFKKTLTEDEISARIHGKPSYMSGLIYPTFSRKLHLKERFKIPISYLVDISIDIHPREKQAILFCATSPDNRKYVCEEIWENGDGTQVGEWIVKAARFHGYTINRIICDPLAKGDKNQPNTTYDKIEDVLYKYGYQLETASKDLSSGIITVKDHLMGPNNEPSVFFFNDLIRTLFEIEGYMWDKESGKPLDQNDHMMENLYRLLLLDTKWYDVSDYEYEELYDKQGRDVVGGY